MRETSSSATAQEPRNALYMSLEILSTAAQALYCTKITLERLAV